MLKRASMPLVPTLANSNAVSKRYRAYVFTVLTCVSTLSYLDRQIVNILAEPIKHDLQLADWQLGMITGLSFAIFYCVLGIPIARLADRSHRPRIIAISLATWSAFTLLCGLSQNFFQMLLARVGVGSGEAGGTPPSHSLIADLTTPQNRASALALFSLGFPLGALIGMGAGGMLADAFGWRSAFFIAAAPGLLLALLVALTIKEPRRDAAVPAPTSTLRESLTELAGKKTFWWITAGGSASGLVIYGQNAFYGSFFLRHHSAEMATWSPTLGALGVLGLLLGVVSGGAGILGMLLGGKITDVAVKRSLRSYCTVPALALTPAAPLFMYVVLAPSAVIAAAVLFVPVLLHAMIFGPSFAAIQTLVRPQTRATAAAVALLVITLVGLGLGPVMVGALSDLFAQKLGSAEGLRWAMAIQTPIIAVAAGCFWMARRTVLQELETE